MPTERLIDDDGNTVLVAVLRDWCIGKTRTLSPYSDTVQWILDAHWYNFTWEDREHLTRDVEASKFVKVTPTRLGVWLHFCTTEINCNRMMNVYVQLYNTRVMKMDCFAIQTYESIFAKFFADLS